MRTVEYYQRRTAKHFSKPVREMALSAIKDREELDVRLESRKAEIARLRQVIYRLNQKYDRRYI